MGFRQDILPFQKCIAIYNTSAGQSIPSGVATVINFDTMELDTDSAVTTGASWKFTCPTGKTGVYLVTGVAGFALYSVAATVFAVVYVNGGQTFRSNRFQVDATDGYPYVVWSGLVNLNAGDYVQVQIYQGAGVNKTLEGTGVSNRVSICRIAGA